MSSLTVEGGRFLAESSNKRLVFVDAASGRWQITWDDRCILMKADSCPLDHVIISPRQCMADLANVACAMTFEGLTTVQPNKLLTTNGEVEYWMGQDALKGMLEELRLLSVEVDTNTVKAEVTIKPVLCSGDALVPILGMHRTKKLISVQLVPFVWL